MTARYPVPKQYATQHALAQPDDASAAAFSAALAAADSAAAGAQHATVVVREADSAMLPVVQATCVA